MVNIAIIGPGKIARDQHVPAMARHGGFALVATAGGPDGIAGTPHLADLPALLAAGLAIDAVAICTPPGPRAALAQAAWAAGYDVLLEKPPAADMAAAALLVPPPGRIGYAAWHSRHAAGVATARAMLTARGAARFAIHWIEDVERWHPGQDWIWRADGFGVVDPGINALSILTAIWPGDWRVRHADLLISAGRAAPERVDAALTCGGIAADVHFNWDSPDDRWDIDVDLADGGHLALRDGGARLWLDGAELRLAPASEYDGVYADFARLLAERQSDIDTQPLALGTAMLAGGTL
ncbi:MAG: Gfo/Idh/MocA family oxidoreductase [Sphingomonadales bacterium]|jgi:predicted dehydrogenase